MVDNDKSGFLSDNSSDDGGGGDGKESKDGSKTIRSVLAKHGSFTFANTSHRNICAETVTKRFIYYLFGVSRNQLYLNYFLRVLNLFP